jgi:DNA polymerase II small subunit/DNA polymerase delta subunit B
MESEYLKEIVINFLKLNIIISPDIKSRSDDLKEILASKNVSIISDGLLYLNSDILELFRLGKSTEFNWKDFEKAKVISERKGDNRQYSTFVNYLLENPDKKTASSLKIISTFEEFFSKKEVSDFTMYFNSRLQSLQKILYGRDELKGVTSISRIISKKERENISLIGMVKS